MCDFLMCTVFFHFFFFKQKTAYEMRISDWSSDVCSSDLVPADPAVRYGLLANGLRYAILRNETPAGKASLWRRVHAGSLMAKENQLGLAHFMEHMAFNGTEDIPENELIHRLERLGLKYGADLHAVTTFDQERKSVVQEREMAVSVDTG